MEKWNIVEWLRLVWKSLQNLEEYVDIDYTIDGDSVHSKFGTSFEFGYYDEDNIEICFYENNKRKLNIF